MMPRSVRTKLLLLSIANAGFIVLLALLMIQILTAQRTLIRGFSTVDLVRTGELAEVFSTLSITHVELLDLFAHTEHEFNEEAAYEQGSEKLDRLRDLVQRIEAIQQVYTYSPQETALLTDLQGEITSYYHEVAAAIAQCTVDAHLAHLSLMKANSPYRHVHKEFLELLAVSRAQNAEVVHRVLTDADRGLALLAGILVVGFLGFLWANISLAHRLTFPIRDLAQTMDTIARQGTYEVRVPDPGSRDELAVLVTGFNAMLGAVQERDRKLSAVNAELEERVKARTEELARERDQLAKTNAFMMDREERILELKRKTNDLLKELGRGPDFSI